MSKTKKCAAETHKKVELSSYGVIPKSEAETHQWRLLRELKKCVYAAEPV